MRNFLCILLLTLPISTVAAETTFEQKDFASMRTVPYFKDKKPIGLRLHAIEADSFWQKIGMRNGDILKEVNGVSTPDAMNLNKILPEIYSKKNFFNIFKIERAGEEIEIRQ